jgi:flagellar biosynthetic protein FlhB
VSDDYGDKTEAPTLRRRLDARRQGQVARSGDLAAAAVLVCALLLMQATGPKLMDALRQLVAAGVSTSSPALNFAELMKPVRPVYHALRPLLIGLVVVAIAVNVIQVGFLLRSRPPKSHVLDVFKGFERLLSKKTFVRLVGHALKLVIVTLFAYVVTRNWTVRIISLEQFDLAAGGYGSAAAVVFGIAVRVAMVLLVLGVADFAYQRWQHERELRMTRREVLDELRQMEGDPRAKRRRREFSATLAGARLERDVAAADVVVFHHSKLAVALRYDAARLPAPAVLLKATGPLVSKVRELAVKHAVPVVEREPLARALHKLGTVGHDVPQNLFAAVADVLAYAHVVRAAARDLHGGGDAS